MSNSAILHTSDAAFEDDVLKSDKPVLLDFWAEWCGPCRAIAPVLEDIATTYRDKLRVAKINVDENELTPAKFNIRSIPTLMLFNNGAIVAQKLGAVPRSELLAFLNGKLQAAGTGGSEE